MWTKYDNDTLLMKRKAAYAYAQEYITNNISLHQNAILFEISKDLT